MDSLTKSILDIMPRNMEDFNEEHQSKIEALLKLDNDDIPIEAVKFAPRRRRSVEMA